MRKGLGFFIFCLIWCPWFSSRAYGQQQFLHLYTDRNFHTETVVDNQDRFRYSISKLFDDDEKTCMAVTQGELKSEDDVFFSLDMGYPEESYKKIVGCKVQPGFFDERYYRSNARIKRAEIYIKTHYESSNGRHHYEEKTIPWDFEDKMEEQVVSFPRSLQGRVIKMAFRVKEVYPGEKWQDVCLSGIEFLHDEGPFKTVLSARPYTSIDWYCAGGQPYMGAFRSDHSKGMMYLVYNNRRISSILIFMKNMYEDTAPMHRCTYNYEYRDNQVIVSRRDHAEKSDEVIRTYALEEGRILSETVIDEAGKGHRIDYTDLSSSDSFRDYIARGGYSSRLLLGNEDSADAQYFYSETNIYDENLGKLKRTLRSDYWQYLVPTEFIFLD